MSNVHETPESCARKRRFNTPKAAAVYMRSIKRRAMDPSRLRVYACEHHTGWHVGNVPYSGDVVRLLRGSK